MSDIMSLIIQEIKENKTVNEICAELNISKKRLYYYLSLLKNKGFYFTPNYYPNGEIIFTTDCLHSIYTYNNFNISTRSDDLFIKTLVISDLHFGNKKERLDLINEMFDYCIKDNIHIILCCGDILDGTFSQGEQKINNGMEQIEHFIKNYPYDSSISTLNVLGDHDFSILKKYNYDPAVIIKNQRHDIGIGGYNYSTINIKNNQVKLHHHFNNEPYEVPGRIVLHGHNHRYEAKKSQQNVLHIYVPTLCDMTSSLPSALKITFYLEKKNIKITNIKQLISTNNHIVELSDISFRLNDINTQQTSEENTNIKKRVLT